MDLPGEYVADNDRYAFLLGSALRNNDSEQFFCIYDAIVPKDLPEVQVEKIKEKARLIADLPEDDFNELVLNARDFSLARGRPPPSPFLAMSTRDHVLSDHSDEDECQIHQSSLVPSLAANASSLGHIAAGMTDDDSGLPSSTKTGRPTSLSSDDTTETDDKDQFEPILLHSNPQSKKGMEEREEKVEVPRLKELVVVSHSYNPEYDEEVLVENDSESVESPRSDASSTREYDVTQLDVEDGTEMTTFSSEQHGYYDEDDSDDNFRPLQHRGNSWRRMEQSRASSATSIQFTNSAKLLDEGKTISSLRSTSASTITTKTSNVDEAVNFSLLGSSSQPSRYSPDRVGVWSGSHLAPPFGAGKDLLDKVGESISSLVKVPSYNLSQSSTDMSYETTGGKKKPKKKKGKRDDGTQEGGDGGKNLSQDCRSPTQTVPQLDDKSSVVSGSGRPVSSGSNNHEMGHMQGEDVAGSQNGLMRQRRRNKNCRQQGVEVHPDQDERYVGNVSNVDHLVLYITNDISIKKVKELALNEEKSNGSRRKERNKKKSELPSISNSDTFSSTSDTAETLVNEHTIAKQTESEDRVGRFDAEDKDMGNSSSAEKIDTGEVGTFLASFSIDVVEPESQKANRELVKREAAINKKNNFLSSNMDSSITKNINDDNKDNAKARDKNEAGENREEEKTNSKKWKSKTPKKNSKKPEKVMKPKPTSLSSPATPDISVDVDSSQEQWCTVLSKPQKKKRSQGQTAAMAQNGFAQVVTQQAHLKGLVVSSLSHSEPRAESQNSVFQQPNNKIRSKISYLEAAVSEEKNLSPSDFPVLRVNTESRNFHRSLENLSDVSSLTFDKDSDRESSKSYPADLGTTVNGRAVSYATKASRNTAHESTDSSKAESVSSSVEDSSLEFGNSSLVWKGSPQERRHSIGSAPKELCKNALQRTGSQEMLPRDKDCRSTPVTIPSAKPDCKNLIPSDSTSSFAGSDADSTRGSEVGSEGTGEDFVPSQQCADTILPHSDTTTSVENKPTNILDGKTASNMNTKTVQRKATVKSIPVESAVALGSQRAVKNETKVSRFGAEQAKNGQKRGVEFCYKTLNPNTECQYDFGFFQEDEIEQYMFRPMATNKAAYACDKQSKVTVSAEDTVKAKLSHSQQDDGDASLNLSRGSQEPHASAHTVPRSNKFPSKSSKGPHIAGLNGIVLPQNSDISPTLVLPVSSNSLPITEQNPICVSTESKAEEVTTNSSVCTVSSSNCPEATESAEPVGEPRDRIVFTYGPSPSNNEPQKRAVYLRPPEDMTTKTPSENLIKIKDFFRQRWLSAQKTQENAENHQHGSLQIYDSGKKY